MIISNDILNVILSIDFQLHSVGALLNISDPMWVMIFWSFILALRLSNRFLAERSLGKDDLQSYKLHRSFNKYIKQHLTLKQIFKTVNWTCKFFLQFLLIYFLISRSWRFLTFKVSYGLYG